MQLAWKKYPIEDKAERLKFLKRETTGGLTQALNSEDKAHKADELTAAKKKKKETKEQRDRNNKRRRTK